MVRHYKNAIRASPNVPVESADRLLQYFSHRMLLAEGHGTGVSAMLEIAQTLVDALKDGSWWVVLAL